MKKYLWLIILAFVLSGNSFPARAQSELSLFAPSSIKVPLAELIPDFENKTGYQVKTTTGPGTGIKKQVIQGDAFDVTIVQPPLAYLVASGNVVADTGTPLASIAVGVAVRKGASKPDISTPEAVKRMLLGADSVAYPDPAGGSAVSGSVESTLKELGISEQIQSKVKFGRGDPGTLAMVAKGEAEIGLAFVNEMRDPGIDVVGSLPPEISPRTSYVGYISAHAKDTKSARALLEYLSSPEAAAVYTAHGMQPGR